MALYRDASNVAFTPMADGKALDEAEFAQLPEEVREQFHEDIAALEERLNEELASLPQWKRESNNQLRQLNEETITLALQPLLAPLSEKYAENAAVCAYLQSMQLNLLRTVVEQLVDDSKTDAVARKMLEEQYAPSLVVGHHVSGGAPMVFEPHPTYDNLFGRIEYSTDQGALHLLSPAAPGCAAPGQWWLPDPRSGEDARRAVRLGRPQARPAIAQAEDGIAAGRTGAGRQRDPHAADDPAHHQIGHHRFSPAVLRAAGPRLGLREMFRVLVDFDEDMPMVDENLEQFAQLLRTRTNEEGMAPLTSDAVARLATYSARLAENQSRLSARIGDLFQLVSEADFIRQLASEDMTDAGHIERALKAKATRTGRVSQRVLDDMLAGIILIDTEGAAIGKCNGLTVLEVGDSAFGMPARISATVYPGGSGIVDIEREVNLGQPIHSKGVMILTGYLGSRYARSSRWRSRRASRWSSPMDMWTGTAHRSAKSVP